ncbi:PAS domain S-box protein [Salinibacter grassmerensis]|uniref:PAS domain S-box protein n=1 Tax=Salinibacter grassmerensis TaxID=3040353 RepID=UPI0021E87408|nr:PAS domain S-box protein [Salinibacter grassmerensis]
MPASRPPSTNAHRFDAEALQVLLVEDNPGDARLFEEYLDESTTDAVLHHESTLQAGLQALSASRPDVVVVDLGLPDSQGTETVRATAGAAAGVPIVVLTGQNDLQAALKAQEAGATEYLQKEELTPALVGRTLRWSVQRRGMQAKLQQRDAWIRSITEGLSAGVFRAGPTGRIDYANEALADMLGAGQVEELTGLDLTTFCTDPLKRGQMLVEEGASDVEIEFEGQDGSVFVGLLSATAAYDESGKVIYYDGVVTDITERARRKKKLRMLSEAVDQAAESVLITEARPLDEPGPRVEYVNSAYEEMTGYSEAEMIGKTPRILQGPETDRDALDSLREALEAGEAWTGETVNYSKNGDPYQVQWNVSPVRNDRGSIEHWVSVQRDVTEERQRQEELRNTKNFYEQILDEAPIDLAVFNLDAEFQYVNPESVGDPGVRAWMLGRTNEDYCRERGLDPELGRRRDQAIRRAAEDNETVQFEEAIETDGGTHHYLRVHSPVTDLDGEVTQVVAFGLDITERKERERELVDAKEEAERMNRLKSAFLANMSHEIRTPLTSILGFAETIGREVDPSQNVSDVDLSTLAEFSSLIERSGQRLMNTLTGVLNLSKLQAGEMNLSPGPVDLATEARETADQFAPQAKSAGVDLRLQEDDNPVRAWADASGLQIVVRNLLSNAVKYTEEGGEVWVRVRSEEGAAILEVEDTGIGMDPETTDGLFEAFKQASDGVGREYEGTGLGLTVTKEVLDRMGGAIEVETEEGVGSRFTVRLCAAEEENPGRQPVSEKLTT